MTASIIYLLKVSLGLALISLPYYFLLRKDAALNIKRIYLLGGILLSWLAPLLSFRKPPAVQELGQALLIDPYSTELPAAADVSASVAPTFSILSLVAVIYGAGLLFLTARHLFSIHRVRRLSGDSVTKERNIIYTSSEQVFTFFSRIFVPGEMVGTKELDSILIHESAHVQQLHVIDLVIAESNLLLTWFNPFSWLISGMIKENHEHLADRSVLRQGVHPARYKAQLLNHTMGMELIPLGNKFNHSLTKNRFQMMKKIKTPKKGFVKYLALVPAVLIMLGLFTAASAQETAWKGKVTMEDGTPLAGTSIVVSGGTEGTVADRDGSWSIELDGDPELVFSFVGFKSEKIRASKASKNNVILKKEEYMITLDDVGMGDYTLEEEGEGPDEEVLSTNDDVFYVVEDMPAFPGGLPGLKKYIHDHLEYPAEAKAKKMSGEVFVQFQVMPNGETGKFEVLRSTDPVFDNAAVKVLQNAPKWKPGMQRGKKVSVNIIVPVKFNLTQD